MNNNYVIIVCNVWKLYDIKNYHMIFANHLERNEDYCFRTSRTSTLASVLLYQRLIFSYMYETA